MLSPERASGRWGAHRVWQRVGPWRVAFAEGAPSKELARVLESLAAGEEPSDAQQIKSTRLRRVFRTTLADGDMVYVKLYRCLGVLSRWTLWPRRSRARQEFLNLLRVRALELPAVEPLCCAERRHGLVLDQAVLVTRALPALPSFSAALEELDERARAGVLTELGRIAHRLHDAGLWHRDLHGGNLLAVRGSGDGIPYPVLVDLQKLRALHVSLPVALRARDLAKLAHMDERGEGALIKAYASAGRRPLDEERLRARVRTLAERQRRRRLRSRARRCVVPSTGFRAESTGALRIYRRADIETEAVLAALEASVRSGEARAVTFVESVWGGPAPGPAPNPFRRGQGSAEPGAPAQAAVAVTKLPGSAGPWPARSRGMRAWRAAHAALLRGFDTLAPLALVEKRSLTGTRCSYLLTRFEHDECLTAVLTRDPGDTESGRAARHEAVRSAARLLARLHAAGLCYRRFELDFLRLRSDGGTAPMLAGLDELRVCRHVNGRARVASLRCLAKGVAERWPELTRAELALLLSAYRDGGDSTDAAWRVVFADVEQASGVLDQSSAAS